MNNLDQDQIELLENAQKRILQKKRLYYHFVIYLFVSVFSLISNKLLKIGSDIVFLDYSWSFWLSFVWLFVIIFHLFNVFVTNRFLGNKWLKAQKKYLIEIQQNKIQSLKKEMEKEAHVKFESEKFNSNSSLITIIAAASENNVIGKDNKLIWHLSDDLKHFKELTKGHHVIMGRKTFESMPKALPNRTNVIITRNRNYTADNAIVVQSLDDALKISKKDSQPFIIGGGEIYKMAMSIADRIELTRVHADFEGDAFFPEIELSEWKEVKIDKRKKDENHNYDFTFIRYDKI
jgi:dihydrofolate reductase